MTAKWLCGAFPSPLAPNLSKYVWSYWFFLQHCCFKSPVHLPTRSWWEPGMLLTVWQGVCVYTRVSTHVLRWFLGHACVGGSNSEGKWLLVLLAECVEPRWRCDLWYVVLAWSSWWHPPSSGRQTSPNQGRYLKVSLRNRHYPGSLTPEQWVLSATPFRCMVHHHDNHPIIESQSGSRLRHSPPGFPSPSGPPYGVCGTGSCCQKKAPLCLQGMKDIWFSSLPFLSAQHFLRALRPVPRRCPSMLRAQPEYPPVALVWISSRIHSSQSISAFASNSLSH